MPGKLSHKLTTCKLLIDNEWQEARAQQFTDVTNPSTGEVIAKVPHCQADDVNRAVQAAQQAFPDWSQTPVVDRARVMFKFKSLLESHGEELARTVSREHGKTLAESRASVNRGIEVVEFACGIPSLMTGESIDNLARSVDCETVRHPLGVCAGITPFNFPAMVPLWMYPIAITCGNTFVLKPSEHVPLSSLLVCELLIQAGLPAGVFNLVHGSKGCVDALLTHPLVKAVSFVGSTTVARYIYTTAAAAGKRVQAAGGAKNHLIIMPDANIEQTVEALKASAFGCAGERCMAGSLAVPVGQAAEQLLSKLIDSASNMKVGRTDIDGSPDMGPLITHEHLERVKKLIGQGEQEGAQLALDGRQKRVAEAPHGFFLGPTIFDQAKPGMSIVEEEIFGPVLTVVRVNTLQEAIALGANSQYGNGASIFTESGQAARLFKHSFNAGMIGINIGVPAPLAWFPFTGWNNSFFGDLHIQGKEAILFYTQQKMTMTRWFGAAKAESAPFNDPVWKSRV